MSTAVIIGRFQPLHNGHVNLINQALNEHDKVLVLIGSVNKERDHKNPYTYDQRVQMISNVFDTLVEIGHDLLIRGLKDKPTDDEWVQEVIANVSQVEEDPSRVVLYTSEKDVAYYDTHFLYNTMEMDSKELSATNIRNDLYSGMINQRDRALKDVPRENWDYLTSLCTDNFYDFGTERIQCEAGRALAEINHQFENPIEPVAHAVLMHRGDILLVKRASIRGRGQWAIPGGFMEHTETTRQAAIRELKEETGVDLQNLRAKEMAQAVEENLDDLSVRTLGINYLYLMAPTADRPEVTLDTDECLDYKWVSATEILEEKINLFYNHTVVIQRLFSVLGNKGESK